MKTPCYTITTVSQVNKNKHKQKMKQNESGLKRQTYLPPRAECIHIETSTVLCASTMRGNSTEGVTTTGFDWA